MPNRTDDPAGFDAATLRVAPDLLIKLLDDRLNAHEAATAERSAALEARVDARLEAVGEKLEAIIRSMDELPSRVAALEQARCDEERARREADIRADAIAPYVEGLTNPSAASPLRPLTERLGEALAKWTPVQWLVLAALVVGGPTVAGPTAKRLLDVAFGPEAAADQHVPHE